MQLPALIDEALAAELQSNPQAEGMGTTLTLLYLSPDNMINVLHIGDSRVYKVDMKARKLKQLSVDHTVANELFLQGRISADEVHNHPGNSMLTQVLQGNNEHTPMLESYPAKEGDRFLIASDGLSNVINDQEIYETLVNKDESALSTLQKMIEKNGAPDNFTIIDAHIVNQPVGDLVVRLGSAVAHKSGDK
jgi:protein phosphatase